MIQRNSSPASAPRSQAAVENASPTKTPWEASLCDDGLWMIHTAGEVVALSDANSRGEPFHQANAAFIVRAVNNHKALVGALRFILAFYEPGQRHLDTEAWKVAEAGARRALQNAETNL